MIEAGEKRNMLTFLGEEIYEGKRKKIKVRCECGKEKYIRKEIFGKAKSCGCINRNKYGINPAEWETLFGVYRNMIHRCYVPETDRYKSYGGKGIKVCDKWNGNFKAFADFAITNGWKKGLSIERKNVYGNYEPDNCTFITMKEQARNKTSCIYIAMNGTRRCIAEWCENMKTLNAKAVYARYSRGIREPCILLYDGDLRGFKG